MELDWKKEVSSILKAEMVRRGVTQEELMKRLTEIGASETKGGIANKLSRGTFSAIFFVQCLKVLGCKELKIDF